MGGRPRLSLGSGHASSPHTTNPVMADTRKPIPPNPPRFEPTHDPANIHVPGLDTSAPVNDQLDQIEQLITIQLQNIDANFSKINHLLASKVLPAVKRYAVNTEPVREAAKFWTSFYEQAAQTRIPTYDDYSAAPPSEYGEEDDQTPAQHTTPGGPSKHYDDSSATRSDESSFMPGAGAFASTPAPAHRNRQMESFDSNSVNSWMAPESPLVRLDRELQNFSLDDEAEKTQASSQEPYYESSADGPTPAASARKGKGKAPPQPLLRGVLKQAAFTNGDSTGTPFVSPLRPRKTPKAKTPVALRAYNPYIASGAKPNEWNGLVDLSKPAPTTPGKRGAYGIPSGDYDFGDDSFDLPTPPKMMSPALLPRSSSELKLAQTPGRDAAGRIGRDLLKDMASPLSSNRSKFGHGGYQSSSMSTMPTPPSVNRYQPAPDVSSSMGIDSSLESMMRRVGAAEYAPYQDYDERDYDDSAEYDEEEEINNTVNPSPAFLALANSAQGASDDSYGSTDSEPSMREDESMDMVEQLEGTVMYDDGGGDSYDSEDEQFERDRIQQGGVEEETVFGLQPQVRSAQGGQLRLLGEIEENTTNVGMHINPAVYDSPTPTGR